MTRTKAAVQAAKLPGRDQAIFQDAIICPRSSAAFRYGVGAVYSNRLGWSCLAYGASWEEALMTHLRLEAEESRLPQHQVCQLSNLHRSYLRRASVGNSGIDSELRDVSPRAQVVMAAGFARVVQGRLRDETGNVVGALP